MQEKIISKEFEELFAKILFPAFLTVAVVVAIEMKNGKSNVSFLNAILSFIIGVSGAYLASGVLSENFSGGKFTIVLCSVALLTEKTVKFIMTKFDIDLFLTAILEWLFDKLKNFLK